MAGETSKERLEVLLQIKDLATAALKRFEEKTGAAAKRSESHFAKSEAAVDRLRRGIVRMGVALATVFAARKVVQSIVDFEQGLVGVGKTADISGSALEGLGEQFIGLSRKIPVGVGQLLDIGRAAGQLGVQGAPNILKFTETVARLAAASADFQGEEAATTLARFLTVTGEGVGDVDRLASTITDLGNKTAATEREIALAGLSVGQATAIFNIGAANAAAFGAALSQLGVQVDLAGSTIGRTFRAIDAALREQGKGAETLVQITGKSVEDLSNIFRTDAVAGFQVFLKGLQNVVESGGDATKVLEALNIADIRIQKVLPVLSKNYDLLAQKLGEANREWQANQALTKESERAFGTLGGSLTKLGNTFEAAILKFRDSRGALQGMTAGLTSVIEQFFGLETGAARPSFQVVAFTTVVKLATAALAAFVTTKALAFLSSLATGLKAATLAMIGLNTASKINPFVAFASIAAAAATAIGLFSLNADAAYRSVDRLGDVTLKYLDATAELERAQFRLSKALAVGDMRQRIRALEELIGVFERAQATLEQEGGRLAPDFAKNLLGLEDLTGFKQSWAKTRMGQQQIITESLKKLRADLGPLLRLQVSLEFDATSPNKVVQRILAAIALERTAIQLSAKNEAAANVVRKYGTTLLKMKREEAEKLFPVLLREEEITLAITEAEKKRAEAAAKRKAEAERQAGLGFKQGFTSVVSQFDEASERLTILGESVAQGMLDVFTIEFFDPMTGRFKSLEDIARSTLLNIANAIQRVISQQIALAAVSGIAGGLGINLAKLGQGGVLDSGRLVKAQQGIVVNAPTVISGGRGPGVLAGEARQPEGVFPLVRDKSGDLGIRAVGGGGGNNTTITVNQTINAPPGTDAEGLARRSGAELERTLSRWFVGQMARGTPVRRSVIEGVKKG